MLLLFVLQSWQPLFVRFYCSLAFLRWLDPTILHQSRSSTISAMHSSRHLCQYTGHFTLRPPSNKARTVTSVELSQAASCPAEVPQCVNSPQTLVKSTTYLVRTRCDLQIPTVALQVSRLLESPQQRETNWQRESRLATLHRPTGQIKCAASLITTRMTAGAQTGSNYPSIHHLHQAIHFHFQQTRMKSL